MAINNPNILPASGPQYNPQQPAPFEQGVGIEAIKQLVGSPSQPQPLGAPLNPQELAAAQPVEVQPQPVQPQAIPVMPVQAQPDLSAIDRSAAAILNAAALGDKKAAEIEAYTKSFEQRQVEDAKKAQDEFDARQQEVALKLTDLDKKLDEIGKQQIDPNRVFSSMSMGQKLGTFALAALAGEGGQRVLDNMIQRDIAAQEANRKNILDVVGQKKSLYGDLLGTFKDKISARNALAASMYQAAQTKLEGMAAVTKNAQVKANMINQIAELEAKKEQYKQEFAKRQQLLAAEQQLQVADPITAKINRLPQAAQKPLLEAKERYDSVKAGFNGIDKIFQESKKIGPIEGNIPFSDAKAQVEANRAQIEGVIREALRGQGTIQETEIMRLVLPFTPEPTDSESRLLIKKQKLKDYLINKTAGEISRLSNMGLIEKNPFKTSSDLINPKRVK